MAATISSAISGFKVRVGFASTSWSVYQDHDRMTSMGTTMGLTRVGMRRRVTVVRPMMKNVNEGKGVFAPVVVLARNIIGKKQFNQIRGKAIAVHSQVITEFCKTIGADPKQRQGLIRLAKKNGEKLGFLA